MAIYTDPDPTVLEANLRRLVGAYEHRVQAFEHRYEMRSTELAAELAAERVRETAEVAEWVVAWRTLEALRRELAETPVE